MTYLIVIVLLSTTLMLLMVIFKGCRFNFWTNSMNSKIFKKTDLFFENLFKLFKFKFNKSISIVKKETEILSFKMTKFFNLILNKISRKINNQFNKFYIQKVNKPTSNYLKNVEEYKNGKEEREKF